MKQLSVQAQTVIEELPALLNWGNQSVCGPGSSSNATEDIREHLPKIFKKYKIKSMIDAACGDFHWMKEVDLKGLKFHGYDIMPEYIEDNKERFGSKNIKFEVKDVIEEKITQEVDLIMCRDLIMHLRWDKVKKLIKNFKNSKSKYLLATNFSNKNSHNDGYIYPAMASPPNPPEDWDKEPQWGWRPLNLLLEPFNFPKPAYSFVEENENCGGRSVCLWELKKIKI